MFSQTCRCAGVVAALCCSVPAWAQAQQSPPEQSPAPQQAPPAEATPPGQEPPPQGEPAPLSPEEQAEINQALGADAKSGDAPGAQQQPSQQQPESAGTQAPPSVGIHGLDISLILDVAGAAFTSDAPLQTGDHDPSQRGFNLQQLELSVGSVVDPYFRFDSNIVFHQDGVEIEEAYATTLALPANLQVRAGQFLTKFGRLNATHPHAWEFVDQPFAIGRVFGGEGNRGLGIEASWLSPLPWYLEVVGSVTDAHGEGSARSFLGDADHPVQRFDDFQFTGAVKQFFSLSDDLSLLWGLSAANGPNPAGDPTEANPVASHTRTQVYGTDLYLRYRPTTQGNQTTVTWQTELLYRHRDLVGDSLHDYDGYSQLAWHFNRRWAVAGRYELGTAAKNAAGQVVEDPLDPEWTKLRQRISTNVTYYPTEFSRLRLQGATDRAGWRDSPDYSLFLAFEVVVGAHGAHTF
ncbi:zinc-regulated TonB-dependent outer membrane receptor [Aggregicoccus sp. 17bor-14]|nr:zinc-regulated TonB-dependent outer membrane receptor [Simulacricoccus sp. 17bor-14]MRI87064.1 zinc-regulated TonB-dependent outer membrane receptor [Aggregicoccus sp. 17bor-14]